jgi:hypothetical protein
MNISKRNRSANSALAGGASTARSDQNEILSLLTPLFGNERGPPLICTPASKQHLNSIEECKSQVQNNKVTIASMTEEYGREIEKHERSFAIENTRLKLPSGWNKPKSGCRCRIGAHFNLKVRLVSWMSCGYVEVCFGNTTPSGDIP